MTDPIFQERLPVRERRAPVPWVVAAGTVLATFLVGVFVRTHGPMIAALMAGAAFALAASLYVAVNWSTQKRRKDTPLVRAENGALSFDGRRFGPIEAAYLQPQAENASAVRVVGSWLRRADVLMPDDARADELLRALRVDPARSITRFRVYAGLLSNKNAQTILSAVLGIGAFNAFNLFPRQWKIPGALALFVLSALNWAPSSVAVGPDGLLVTSPTRLRRKFVPFAEIESATTTHWGVTLTLRSQRTIELRTENQPRAQSETRDALLRRIRAGIAAFDPAASIDVASLVARGSRPVDEWIRALRDVTKAAAGYRVAAVPEEKLWRVVEDPAADPSARAGAAAALSGSLDDDARARLRALAENAVHPRVRVALDAVASSDDDRVREALEACAEDELKTSRAGSTS